MPQVRSPQLDKWCAGFVNSLFPPEPDAFGQYTSYSTLHVILFRIACALSRFSCVQLFETPWIVAGQAPMSMELSRQEYQSGLPCPAPGSLGLVLPYSLHSFPNNPWAEFTKVGDIRKLLIQNPAQLELVVFRKQKT